MGSLLTLCAGATGLVYPRVVVLMLGPRDVDLVGGLRVRRTPILARSVRWGGLGFDYVRLTGRLRTKHSIAPCGPGQVPERGGRTPSILPGTADCHFLQKGGRE